MNVARRAGWLGMLVVCAGPATACGGLEAGNAWVRQPPPGHEYAAGYVSLVNPGGEPVTITGVASPQFGHAMLHETRYEDGQARMRHLHAVEISAGERFEARPGGNHLMLGTPVEALAEGDVVTLVFECAGGGRLEVEAPVRRRAPE